MNDVDKARKSRKACSAPNHKVICPYCDNEALLVSGRSIYPHRPDLFNRYFYECEPCGAYVGCHRANKKHGVGTVPLGRLANAELRRAKCEAHKAFDLLWREGSMRRGAAYTGLANALGIPQKECHIGMFDVAQCEQVIKICKKTVSLNGRGASGDNAVR